MGLVRVGAAAAALIALSGLALAHQRPGPPKQKVEKKAQAEVASKETFGTVAASSPDVKRALESHDIAGARKLVGKQGAFHGTVAKVYAPKSNALVILNFDPDYKKALVAVVKSEDFTKFPRLETLKDKRVLVKGKFVEYNGTPELSLTDASQIKIVK